MAVVKRTQMCMVDKACVRKPTICISRMEPSSDKRLQHIYVCPSHLVLVVKAALAAYTSISLEKMN